MQFIMRNNEKGTAMTPPIKAPVASSAPVAGNTSDVDTPTARQLWEILTELQDALRMIEKHVS